MDAANRVQLLDLIKEVEKKVPALYRNAGQIVSESLKKINSMLDVRKHEILEALEKQLNAFPLPEPLPGKPQVVAFLVQEVNAAINIANIECRSSGLQLQESYDYWIEDNLKQIRTVLSGGTKQRTLDTTDIEQFEMPQVDLAGAVGLSIFSGILSLITMPEIIIPVIIISFIGDLFVSAQSRRAKRISKTMDSSRNIYNKCFEKLKTLYEESIIEHADLIKVHAKNRLDLYFYDLRTQLNNIRTNITNSELQLYESALVQLRELHKQIVFF